MILFLILESRQCFFGEDDVIEMIPSIWDLYAREIVGLASSPLMIGDVIYE
jgi:hypothetical protein